MKGTSFIFFYWFLLAAPTPGWTASGSGQSGATAPGSSGERPSAKVHYHYFENRLHQSLQAEDWYAAKQALNQLQNLDSHTYHSQKYPATRAMIAMREAHWETAYQNYQSLPGDAPETLLDQALCLQALGRNRDVIQSINQAKRLLRGSQLWTAKALLARNYEALGEKKKATRLYRELRSSKAPADLRMSAYEALLSLYYREGDRKNARSTAAYLQDKRKASDGALFALKLQEQLEDPAYLARPSVLRRFAEVSYANRDFDRSDHYYARLADSGDAGDRGRAQYFLALTQLKQGRVEEGLDAFSRVIPDLLASDLCGPAAFQYGTALYMAGHDAEVLTFVERYHRQAKGKWAWECTRLEILALRRIGDRPGYQALGERLMKTRAPGWLRRNYHRNGVIWALRDHLPERALAHLQRYRNFRLKRHEQLEAILWEGLVHWEMNRTDKAVDAWLKAAFRDPNHYTGLVARDLIRQADASGLIWANLWQASSQRLDNLDLDRLRKLYFLAPDNAIRTALGRRIQERLPDRNWLNRLDDRKSTDRAFAWAQIGRYDLAAKTLSPKRRNRTAYHFLKSLWHQQAKDLNDSIRHAEILLANYPRWFPYELMPAQVQKLAFPDGFAQIIRDKADTFQVDPYLLLAIIREESRFDSQAKSWASARGLMQFIPETAKEMARGTHGLETFSLPMLYDPKTSITLGAKYVNHLLTTFDGDPLYAVAAYNAGEQAVDRWRGLTGRPDPLEFVWDVSYSETKYYCQKVLRAYHHYTRVYEGKGQVIDVPSLDGPETRSIAIPR